MIRRLSKREQKIFVLCLLTALIYVGYAKAIKPLQARIDLMDAKITKQNKKIQQNLKTIKKAAALEPTYDQYIKKFKQSGSNEQVMSSILSEIEQVARELDLRISDLKPKRVQSAETHNRFSVSLTIDSEFVDIIHFLYLIQTQPHLFDVDEVQFDKGASRRSTAVKTQLVLGKNLVP